MKISAQGPGTLPGSSADRRLPREESTGPQKASPAAGLWLREDCDYHRLFPGGRYYYYLPVGGTTTMSSREPSGENVKVKASPQNVAGENVRLKSGQVVPPKCGGTAKSHFKSSILNYETTLPQNMFRLHMGVCLATPTILAAPPTLNNPKNRRF